jgi:hypothetical protein
LICTLEKNLAFAREGNTLCYLKFRKSILRVQFWWKTDRAISIKKTSSSLFSYNWPRMRFFLFYYFNSLSFRLFRRFTLICDLLLFPQSHSCFKHYIRKIFRIFLPYNHRLSLVIGSHHSICISDINRLFTL